MGFTAVRQAAGSWRLRLAAATPSDIYHQIIDLSTARAGFATVHIVAGWYPPGMVTADNVEGLSRWSGLLRKADPGGYTEPTEISGPGLATLLGDEDDIGPLQTQSGTVSARPFYDGANASWIVTSILANSPGITVGAIASASTPTRAYSRIPGRTARKLLDRAMEFFPGDNEWRINMDRTLDVGEWDDLYRDGEVIVGAVTGGPEASDLRGINAQIAAPRDLEGWTGLSYVNDQSTAQAGDATIGSNPYVHPGGGGLVRDRYTSSNDATDATSADSVAAAVLGEHDHVNFEIGITTDEWDVGAYVWPGDRILITDPAKGVEGEVTVAYRGELVSAVSDRVEQLTEPFEEGMSAYLRWWDGSDHQVTDLTAYVEPEKPGAQIDVGSLPKGLLD